MQYLVWMVDPATMAVAKSEGVNLSTSYFGFQGVILANRAPSAGNPLGNLEVRQALEYAVDRPAIVKALYGELGAATDQVAVPGQPTDWNAAVNSCYPYDPAKAKQLLAQALATERVHHQPRGPAKRCRDDPGRPRVLERDRDQGQRA